MKPCVHAITVALLVQLGRCLAYAIQCEDWKRALGLLAGSALCLKDEFLLLKTHLPPIFEGALLDASEAHKRRRWAYMMGGLDASLRSGNLNEVRAILERLMLPEAAEVHTDERMDSLYELLHRHEGGEQMLVEAAALISARLDA